MREYTIEDIIYYIILFASFPGIIFAYFYIEYLKKNKNLKYFYDWQYDRDMLQYAAFFAAPCYLLGILLYVFSHV